MECKKLQITRLQKKKLIEHARQKEPHESCAILLGNIDSNGIAVIDEVALTENSDKSSSHFSIPNEDLIKIYNEAAKKNLEVVSIFHSHPFSDAFPSATDTNFMVLNPVPWIIFSNTKGDMAAFTLEEKQDKSSYNIRYIDIEVL